MKRSIFTGKPMIETREKPQRMDLPAFTLERLTGHSNKECELMMCIPAQRATHKAIFPDGAEVLICDRHATGIVALGEYLANGPIELEPL